MILPQASQWSAEQPLGTAEKLAWPGPVFYRQFSYTHLGLNSGCPMVHMKAVVSLVNLIYSTEAVFHSRDSSVQMQTPPYGLGTLYPRKAPVSSVHAFWMRRLSLILDDITEKQKENLRPECFKIIQYKTWYGLRALMFQLDMFFECIQQCNKIRLQLFWRAHIPTVLLKTSTKVASRQRTFLSSVNFFLTHKFHFPDGNCDPLRRQTILLSNTIVLTSAQICFSVSQERAALCIGDQLHN